LGWGEILGLTKPTATPPAVAAGSPEEVLVEELADLDLLDLALALEVDFSVVASELRSGKVRTYGELTDALLALTKTRVRAGSGGATETGPGEPSEPFVWARIVPANDDGGGVVHAGALSKDAVQTIIAAAVAGGRGTSVEITVAAPVVDRRAPHAAASARWLSADNVSSVDAQFASLARRGIVVAVRAHAEPAPDAPAPARRTRDWHDRQSTPRAPLTTARVAVAS
jgi:hypothetical protein